MSISFVDEGQEILPELVALRRELHQFPELDLDLPQTRQAVLDALAGLPLDITLGEDCTSVVAVLTGGRPGPTVLLRGDMDGLPVTEQSGEPFSSTNGRMHGCGHDLHISGLVGAARLLAAHRDELPGKVLFMFQPGEEGASGAKVMLDEGFLTASGEKPIAAYGIHVWATIPRGQFCTRVGTLMAGANQMHITVKGKAGHGSAPEQAIDSVPVACEIVLALQTYATRKVDTFEPVIITVSQVTAEGPINIVRGETTIGASVRTLSPSSLQQLQRDLPVLAENIAEAYGCTAEVHLDPLYPATINAPAETAEAMDVLRETFGGDRVSEVEHPAMGSEDFSFVLERVPGTFILLGARREDRDPATLSSNHSEKVLFDDSVLGDEAAALAQIAWSRLERAAAEGAAATV